MDALARLSRKIHAFAAQKSGQVALTFALATIPLLVVVGAAIDYSRAVTARTNLQQATDATVLAIAHSYLNSLSTSLTLAIPTQTYLTGAMNSPAPSGATVTVNGQTGTLNAATVTAITLSNTNTQICITTTMIIPTTIMAIINSRYMAVGAYACSQTGATFEVALVLDNSYSMNESAGGDSKMVSLQTAADKLVDILIPDNVAAPSSAISLVPFNALVNAGLSSTSSYIDTNGASSIHWQNFNIPNGANYKPTSKLDLYSAMGIAWGGCVEERPAPYTTTDTAATSSNADTLFVPYLAPDDPGPVNAYGGGGLTYNTDGTYYFFNSYLADGGASNAGGVCSSGSNTTYKTQDLKSSNIYPGGGLTMACKYSKSSPKVLDDSSGLQSGPNFMCSTPAVTPLTTRKSTIKTAIDAMQPTGSTNLAAGFMWGWRTISPVFRYSPVTLPLAIGPQNPKAYNYGPPSNTKIIILMTDGYNSWTALKDSRNNPYNPFMSTYETFGYMANNRLSTYNTSCGGSKGTGFTTTYNSWRCQMDNVTLEACQNAKAAGVVVYTVGFTISSNPIDAQGINLLKSCASSSDKYYQASTGDEIVARFQEIAASIQQLRISY